MSKSLIFVIIGSLIIGSLFLRQPTESPHADTLTGIIVSHSRLIPLFSVSSVTLELMCTLLREELGIPEDPLSGKRQHRIPETPANSTASAPCAVSLSGFTLEGNSMKCSEKVCAVLTVLGMAFHCFCRVRTQHDMTPPGPALSLFVTLMHICSVLRPSGSILDEPSIHLFSRDVPRLASQAGFYISLRLQRLPGGSRHDH